MTRDDLLRRVEGDLAAGHSQVAINRLTMAAKAAPSDLALRARLAGLHRQTGNWAEAGRWGYFEEPVDERSRQAFEKAWRGPRAQRAAVRWSRAADDPEVVRTRLDLLDELIAGEARRQPKAHDSESTDVTLGCLILAVVVVLFLLGVLTGVVTLVRWVF